MIKYIMHYAPARIIPGLINFVGLMLYARLFTQEEYGRYAYILALLGLVQTLLFPWIKMTCTRFFQKYNKQGREVEFENFTLFLFLIMSLFLILGWFIFTLFFNMEESLKNLYFLGLLVIISQALFDQLMSLARAKLKSKLFAYNMILSAILRISIVLLLVFLFNMDEKSLFIGMIIAQTIPVMIYFNKHFTFKISYFRINRVLIKESFKYGFPLTFTFLLGFIINSSDRIFIEFYLDEKAVGLYSMPYDITTFTLTNIFMIFSLAFFPVLVNEIERNGKKQIIIIKKYSEVLFAFTLPFTIFMILSAPYIANLFLGDNYATNEAVLIIRLISISSFLAGLKGYFFDYSFQLGNKTHAQIIPVIISAVVNIVFNILFIPLLGVNGAVVATIISYLIGILLSVLIGRKIFPMTIHKYQVLKILIINSFLLVFLYYFPFKEINLVNFIINTVAGSGFYFILLVIFNICNIRGIILKYVSK